MTRFVAFLCGIGVSFGLMSCAGGYVYKHYGLSEDVDYAHGSLLAKEPKDDEPFKNCQPTEIAPGKKDFPCVVSKRTEYYKMVTELEEARATIARLEKNCAQ